MPSSHDCEVDVVPTRERYRRIVAAAACGFFLLILAGTVAALVAANRRAVQAFDSEPRIAHDAIAHDARPRATSAPASTTASAAAQMQLGGVAAPEAMWENLGSPAHQGRKKHGRRFARWRSHGGLFGFFARR
jgi:hypothetical protein